jgi:hypothetical protein
MSSGEEKLFVVEEFIEGSYKKHNNNAGYVDQVLVFSLVEMSVLIPIPRLHTASLSDRQVLVNAG